jgi:metallo-beta-lactamase class B
MHVHRPVITFALGSIFLGSVMAANAPLAPAAPPASVPSAAPVAPPPGRAWVQQLFDSLKAPVPPRHLVGNIYYVGASGVSSFLITTPEGHILLDTGFEDTVAIILRGVEQLGFRLSDIKILLSSHAHIDHTGGHALMQRLTGARIYASAADARVLESGGVDDFIPWPRDTIVYAPVKVDHLVADGGTVTLGGVTLTAHLTPGHTRGATTWTMDVAEGGRTYHVVFFSSVTVNPGVRLLGNAAYPEIVSDYEATFARLKALPCDIFFAAHGYQFGMTEKFARQDQGGGPDPFIDPAGWRALLASTENAYRNQLERETTAAK